IAWPARVGPTYGPTTYFVTTCQASPGSHDVHAHIAPKRVQPNGTLGEHHGPARVHFHGRIHAARHNEIHGPVRRVGGSALPPRHDVCVAPGRGDPCPLGVGVGGWHWRVAVLAPAGLRAEHEEL